MKKYLFFILFIFIIYGCSNKITNNKRTVTVTIEPLRYFTEQIAGDKIEVQTMVAKGGNPETYEPTAKQMANLQQSDLYIKVGNIGFERTWMKKLKENAPHTIFVDSSDGISYSERQDGAKDPHTWMSTTNAIIIANNIYHALSEIDNKDSIYFKQNLKKLICHIGDVDDKIKKILVNNKNRTFLIYHPALTYYAKDYKLRQIAIEEEGREPSANQLLTTIALAKSMKVKKTFVLKEFSNRNTLIVSNNVGSKAITINPFNYEWDKEMVNIAEKLK